MKMFDSGGNSGLAAITIGGVFQSNDEIVTPMRLLGSNPDAIPAYISTPIDEEAWRVGADFRLLGTDGMSLRFNYVGEFGKDVETHSGGVNLCFRF